MNETVREVFGEPNLIDVNSICSECATDNGFVQKDKVVGVWRGKCDVCGKVKNLTSLHHDWTKTGKAVK